MGTPQSTERMSTGLLSEGERGYFQGEKEVEDPDGYRRNARYRARQRMDQIEKDIEVLKAAGEDDLVDEFFNRFGRVRQLEQEVERLREQIEAGLED